MFPLFDDRVGISSSPLPASALGPLLLLMFPDKKKPPLSLTQKRVDSTASLNDLNMTKPSSKTHIIFRPLEGSSSENVVE